MDQATLEQALEHDAIQRMNERCTKGTAVGMLAHLAVEISGLLKDRDRHYRRAQELERALEVCVEALEHVNHRPLEHYTEGPLQKVTCEIVNDAIETGRATLAGNGSPG